MECPLALLPSRRPRPKHLSPKPHQPNHKPALFNCIINSQSQIRFRATNPCSLNGTKKDELKAKLAKLKVSEKPLVIILAATWFGETSDVHIAGYQLHRKDKDGRDGGVAIYTQENIVTFEVSVAQLNSQDIEPAWRTA